MNIERELTRLSIKGGLNKQYTRWIRLDIAIRKCKQAIEETKPNPKERR